jgi:hypothetical protein
LLVLTFFGAGNVVLAQSLPPPPVPPPPLTPPASGLVPAPAAATPAPPQNGPWKVLFDGKTVTGLRGLQKPEFLKAGWKIEDGALVLPKDIKQSGRVTGGDLVTTEAYLDFEFIFEWKLTVSADTGVLYFAKAGMGQKPSGHEFQIIDDVRHPDGLKGGPPKRTGALYGVIPPAETKKIRDGQWNEGLIRVQGNHVEHWINREKVLEYELGSPELLRGLQAASKTRLSAGVGTKFKSPVLLLDQGDEVAFRALRVRALAPKPPSL